ncbi:MAG: hypothetical protein NXH75_12495, partial [Halobacteriovoraceae bacterium]|nr:hypothetical protein [Halobacteriovoraceae bacterium]
MRSFSLLKFLTLIWFSFAINFAFGADLSEFYVDYKTGNYQSAVDKLVIIPNEGRDFEATRNYLMALCYKGMQRHDKAVTHFKQAIRLGKKSEDIFFEYAQSLFAINDLESAKRAFRISFEKKHKPDFSLYYIAHIGELLEDGSSVKKNYVKLIKDPNADKSLKQVAYFRLAELIYSQTKDKFYANNYIVDYVVPLLDKAEALNPKSDT